jgi:choice-of-anchor B domain-containing protein
MRHARPHGETVVNGRNTHGIGLMRGSATVVRERARGVRLGTPHMCSMEFHRMGALGSPCQRCREGLVRHASTLALVLAALTIGAVQPGTGQSPEPPLVGHCDCSKGICPLGPGGRACSCGCGQAADLQPVQALTAIAREECRNGRAGTYPCSEIDLLSFLPLGEIGGGSGNDIWGWTDPETGREYALVGRSTGTSFVDITSPEQPRYLGNLPTQTVESLWRDIEVYASHAFIVSEAPNHGMQVFDLRQLRQVGAQPVTFAATAHYAGFGSAHTLAIDAGAGFAYAAGTRTCAGGPHAVNVQDPGRPRLAGCYGVDGYTHDAQCIVYDGPDRAHAGREICLNSNEDTLTIVDTSDKHAQREISRTGYETAAYTHQGWLTDDRRFFLVDDEGDERAFGTRTRTYVWDVSDLDAPFIAHVYEGSVPAIDHNLFVRGDLAYESNYRSGLRVLALGDLATAPPREVGFFDVYPADDAPEFNGAWSNYPFFASGNVIVNGIEQGLFVLRPRRAPAGLRRGVSVSLAATNRPAVAGSDLVHIARVVNHGSESAAGVQLTVQLPDGATSVSPSQGTCSTTTIVTCTLGTLAGGGNATIAVTSRPRTLGAHVASARVSFDRITDDADDNVATQMTPVESARRELLLAYPNGGETVRLGRAAMVQFTLRGVEGGVRVELSSDDGRTWTPLAATAPNNGFFDWVPSGGTQLLARVRVTSVSDPQLTATSAAPFTIR